MSFRQKISEDSSKVKVMGALNAVMKCWQKLIVP